MIGRWLKQIFTDTSPPVRIIYFSPTKDTHLIGKTIQFFNQNYLITSIIRISWLKIRGGNKYVPLYGVRGYEVTTLEGKCIEETNQKG